MTLKPLNPQTSTPTRSTSKCLSRRPNAIYAIPITQYEIRACPPFTRRLSGGLARRVACPPRRLAGLPAVYPPSSWRVRLAGDVYALYTCREASTNSPFYAKQTQFPKGRYDPNTLFDKGLQKMKSPSSTHKTNPNKPNLSRRSLLAAAKCSTKPGWRSRIKPNLSRRSLLAAAKCSTKPGWRSRIKPNQ